MLRNINRQSARLPGSANRFAPADGTFSLTVTPVPDFSLLLSNHPCSTSFLQMCNAGKLFQSPGRLDLTSSLIFILCGYLNQSNFFFLWSILCRKKKVVVLLPPSSDHFLFFFSISLFGLSYNPKIDKTQTYKAL